MTQGITYHSESGEIISANPAAERILGLTLQEMIGRSAVDSEWNLVDEDGAPFAADNHAPVY